MNDTQIHKISGSQVFSWVMQNIIPFNLKKNAFAERYNQKDVVLGATGMT